MCSRCRSRRECPDARAGVCDVEAVGVRSAGEDHRRRAALAGIRRGRGCAAGQVLRARARRRFERQGAIDGVGSCRQAAGEPGYRKLSHRDGAASKCDSRSSSFPDPTAITTRITRRRKCSARKRSSSGTRRRIFAAPMPSFSRAGFRTAITCAPGRSRDFRLSWMPFGQFAADGGPVLGICNGFQILLEAGLLPGAMLRNRGLKFRCEHVHVRVEQTDTPFTLACRPQQVLRIPDRARRRQLLHDAGRAAKAGAESADRVPLCRCRGRGDR